MTDTKQIKERPILFSGEMVRAILEGRKTQTRRIVKPQPEWIESSGRWCWRIPKRAHRPGCSAECVTASRQWWEYMPPGCCPYGQPGDRLWVRETWQSAAAMGVCHPADDYYLYRATDPDWSQTECWTWRPSIHMPRAACRIILEITDVRVERLNEISPIDAIKEGLQVVGSTQHGDLYPHYQHFKMPTSYPVLSFRTLWQSINGPGSWDNNPWVWVVEFKRIEP